MEAKVSFIGAGAMAEALICGWLKNNHLTGQQITVTNRANNSRLEELKNYYHLQTTRAADKVVTPDTFIILACKPKDWQEAIKPYQHLLGADTPVISVLAGLETTSIESALTNQTVPVIRTMPNTSATVGASMTAIAYGSNVPPAIRQRVADLFAGVGKTAEVNEDQMDAMTALTGTGPAYIYYLMEAMEIAAEKMGIDRQLAKTLVAQTLLGAAMRVQQGDGQPAQLYKQIMSPGGTTEAGFEVLKKNNVQEAFISCMLRAWERSQELGSAAVPANKEIQ
ncbi:pyrroline-5-carboxylate reductase [Evansella caseinilytica]|uniref:Pyrroline-5-carboxylate reductase n=1 Tax=Evansella caseinilytica TaxID=1503961 RepID=A0A1H3L4B2_9BACI|nr:pyrroline-5-carboxylate reductase [Evansella caseinilytica]SDY58798.1 pyrroline-5-carboxylate reductase [Evansella caseinilytica]